MKLTGGSLLQTNLCRPDSAGRIRCRWDTGTESLGTEKEEKKMIRYGLNLVLLMHIILVFCTFQVR